MDELDEVRLIIEELHGGLSTLPYHVFLGVNERASGDAIRKAFHERAARFHPDRYYSIEDEELRNKIYAVYKRITEAYRVLSSSETRARYEEQRTRGGVRLDNTERPPSQKRPEDTLTVPQARKYYLMALDMERRGDFKGAKLNLQMAMQLQPDAAVLREMIEKVTKLAAEKE